MIDLKRPAVRSDETNWKSIEVPSVIDEPRYPYGLRLHLEKEELEKLGEQVSDLTTGDIVELRCQAEVCSLSVNNDEYGESASMGLQIQKMMVNGTSSGGKTTVRDALKTLRGKRL